jgi:chaperone LolA
VSWRTVLLWACLALTGAAARADGQPLRAFLSEVRSLQASFEQTLEDEKGRHLETSYGRLYLVRPERFRWTYTAPYVQEIVSDGEQVWVYDSELAQVTVRRADAALASAPGLLLSADRPLDEEFAVLDLGRRGETDWVELTPRSPDSPFQRVRVGLRGLDLAVMELVDRFGQTTRLEFRDTVRNPPLDPGLFDFEPPAGVDVIREDGATP